jgi:hypothetical protein
MFYIDVMSVLGKDFYPCRRKTHPKFEGASFLGDSNVHSASMSLIPSPSLRRKREFPLPAGDG